MTFSFEADPGVGLGEFDGLGPGRSLEFLENGCETGGKIDQWYPTPGRAELVLARMKNEIAEGQAVTQILFGSRGPTAGTRLAEVIIEAHKTKKGRL
jgi:hypothetical protein